MILRQFLRLDPVGISYFLGCGGRSTGLVVDPVSNIQSYLDASEATEMKIGHVVDTHLHADHISAGRALAEATGARYVLSNCTDVAFPFMSVADGDEIVLGNVVGSLGRQAGHDPGEDPHPAPAFPTVAKGLGRTMFAGRIAPTQTIAIDENNTTQNPAIIDTRLAMALGEEGFQTGDQSFRQPEKVAHGSAFLWKQNHKQTRNQWVMTLSSLPKRGMNRTFKIFISIEIKELFSIEIYHRLQ